MVAVFTGNGLGFFDSSLNRLGAGLSQGSGLDRQGVNAANGNLILHALDESLQFRGLGIGATRTYNSLGELSGVGADAWLTGFERRVALTGGTLNQAGSVITLYAADGSQLQFDYTSANLYTSTAGQGASSTLSIQDNPSGYDYWTWQDGGSRRQEVFGVDSGTPNAGRLVEIIEGRSDGTTPARFGVDYDGSGRVSSITALDGGYDSDAILFGYDGSGRLSLVSTRESGAVRDQVAYVYDGQGRLAEVISDLTPGDAIGAWNGIASANDGLRFRTKYTYDGSSLRITRVEGSDGTVTSFTYDGSLRIATVTRGDTNTNDTDGAGETLTFTYGSGYTDVADSLGRSWRYAFDGSKRLTSVQAPAVDGLRDVTTYTYAGDNITSVVTTRGGVQLSRHDYQYDANGNLTWEWDALGNAVQRQYDAANQLIVHTVYTGADADGPGGVSAPSGGISTRYVYDARSRLRFSIDADGGVTEYAYATSGNGIGQQSAIRRYLGASYNSTYNETSLASWVADKRGESTLVELAYDLQGRLHQKTEYAQVDNSGGGVHSDDAAYTRYLYDAQGLLRTQVTLHGSGRSTQAAFHDAGDQVVDYVYDGIGRLLHIVRHGGGTTLTHTSAAVALLADADYDVTSHRYLDSQLQVETTDDAGAVRLTWSSAAGRVVRVDDSATLPAGASTRTAYHYYDASGRLRASEDAVGGRTYYFHDARGHQVATVDPTGALVETEYDASGRPIRTLAHTDRIDTSAWISGSGTGATLTIPALASARPGWGEDFADSTMPSLSGTANLSSHGTGFSLDGGRLRLEIGYHDESAFPALESATALTNLGGPRYRADLSTSSSVASTFMMFALFNTAPGGEYVGLMVQGGEIRLSYSLSSGAGGSTLIGAISADKTYVIEANAGEHQLEFRLYEKGQDPASGIVVVQAISPSTWTQSKLRIQGQVGPVEGGINPLFLDNLSFQAARQVTYTYDASGRLASRSDGSAKTTYHYDGAHRLVKEVISAPGQTDRVIRHFHDTAGRLQATLDAEGYLTENIYDRQGRLVRVHAYHTITASGHWANGTLSQLRPTTDAANDRITRHYYDGRDRLVGTLDAQGYLTELVYDDADNEVLTRAYATQLVSVADPFASLVSTAGAGDWREVKRSFDARGRLTSELNAEGTKTVYHYDRDGRLLRTEVAQGTLEVRNGTQLYDAFGQLIGELDGVGSVDGSGNPRITDGMSLGDKVAVFQAHGTTHAYDAAGRRIESTDAYGNKTWYFHDAAGRVTFTVRGIESGGVKNALGEITQLRYTAFGEVAESLSYTGHVAIGSAGERTRAHAQTAIAGLSYNATVDTRRQYFYDARGLLVQHSDAQSGLTVMRYDALGQLASTTRAAGTGAESTTTYTYDSRGLQVQQVDAFGVAAARTTSQTYDAFGRVVSATDGRGVVTGLGYDRMGRMVSTSRTTYTGLSGAARTETTATTYDAYGRVLTQTNGLGQATAYAYDDGNRSIAVTTPDGLVMTTQRNRHGETVKIIAPGGGETLYEYDRSGRQVRVTDALGHYSTAEYDKRGLLVATVAGDGAGARTEYTYDAAGRRLTRTEDAGSGRLNLVTTWTYDAQGRQLSVTDPAGIQATLSYDREGRVLSSVRDAGPGGLQLETRYAWDAAGQQLSVTEGYGTAVQRTIAYTYDALGRRTSETVDAGVSKLNLVTSYAYDAADNVIARTDAAGNITRYVYDQANRLALTLLPLSAAGAPTPSVAVTRHWYDEAGRLVGTRRYASPLALSGPQVTALAAGGSGNLATFVALADGLASDVTDQIEYRAYDAGGKLRFTVSPYDDTLAAVREVRYDAAGRASHVIDYAEGVNVSSTLQGELLLRGDVTAATAATRLATLTGLVTAQEATAPQSYKVFDAAGNLRFLVARKDATDGHAVEYRYDAEGRVVAEIRHLLTVDFDPAATVASTAAQLSGATATDQQGTNHAYDRLGRLRYSVDDLGIVQERRYDALGQVVETRRYNTAIAPADFALGTIATALTGVTHVRTALNEYDDAGRLVRVTDALGHDEVFGYDAVGNRVSYTNKLDKTWNYSYDAAGRLLEEKAPAIEVFRYTGLSGTGMEVATLRLATRMTYDALGNVLTRTENADAANANERRTTTYEYDSRGNQIKTTFPRAWRIDDSTLALVDTISAHTIEVAYDALGRAVRQKDARGSYTYKAYDQLGRVLHDIDAEGYVTSYAYDAGGRQTVLLRHADRLGSGEPTNRMSGGTYTLADWTSVIDGFDPTGGRVLVTAYDLLGRKSSVQSHVLDATGAYSDIAYWNNAGAGSTGTPETTFHYDDAGNLWLERKLLEGSTWAETRHWYDSLGRRTHTVDAENYLTTWTYDAAGREASRTEYANRVGGPLAAGTPPSAPTAGNLASGYDRTVVWTYDALDRKTSETFVRLFQDATTGANATRNVVTAWAYDAEGRNTTVTADGVATTHTYDALGRLTSVTEAARSVLAADWQSQLLSTTKGLASTSLYVSALPYARMDYDAFGNVVRVYRPALGVQGGTVTADAADQTTFVRYDYQGRAVATTDAEGHSVYTLHSANDQTTVTFYDLSDGQGGTTRIKDLYSYDRLGRQIEHYECRVLGGVDTADGAAAVAYNAFGEIVTKAWIYPDLSNAEKTISYAYDGVGNLVSSDEAGVARRYRYNLAGHQVAELRDPTTSIATRTVLDALGRATSTVLPSHTSNDSLTSTMSRTFDRWGNVVSETDPRGNTTTRVFNDRDQVIRQVAPSVTVVDADGSSATEMPETQWWYDANGRLIGVRDANGNIDRNEYDATGRMTRSLDGLGYATRYAYDAKGRNRVQEDALGYLTTRSYDRNDRVVAIGDYLNAAGSTRTQQAIETYLLNGNGDRIRVTDALGKISKFVFDPRGLLLHSESPTGLTKKYEYDYAGNRKKEIYAPGTGSQVSQTWEYDIHGRLVDHDDLAGVDYNYVYDSAGRLSGETSGSLFYQVVGGTDTHVSLDRTITYYANGLVRRVQLSANDYTEYEYDAAGNRTLEKTYKLGTSEQVGVNVETRITYDSHNRIATVTTDDLSRGIGQQRVLAVEYAYDAAGNRRKAAITSSYGPAPLTQEGWYTYDAENRVLIGDGKLVSGEIVITPQSLDRTNTSFANIYDQLGRVIRRTTAHGATTLSDIMTYDQRGQVVVQAMQSGADDAVVRSTSRYDAAGRLIQRVEYFGPGDTARYYNPEFNSKEDHSLLGMVRSAVVYSYDDDGRLTAQTTWGRNGQTTPAPLPNEYYEYDGRPQDTWYVNLGAGDQYSWDDTNAAGLTKLEEVLYSTAGNASGYDSLGRLTTYRFIRHATAWEAWGQYTALQAATYTHTFTLSYVARDSFLEGKATGSSSNSTFKASSTESRYDAAGRRDLIKDTTVIKDGPDLISRRKLAYNGDGQILLRRYEYYESSTWKQGKDEGSTALFNRWQHVYNATQWTALGKSAREALYDKADTTRATYVAGQQIASVSEAGLDFMGLGNLTGFTNSQLGQGRIQVMQGDTLKTLARRAYGSESLWYVIADANGLEAQDALAAGTTLALPQVKTVTNDANTFRPYDPGELTGATTPSLPFIPPPDKGCGMVGMLIMVAVTVIVSIATYGAAAAQMSALAAGAISGAAGSLVGQFVGNALGVVDGISFKDIALGAITGAIGGAVSSGLTGGKEGLAASTKFAEKLADGSVKLTALGRSATGLASYGANVAGNKIAGRDSGFSWAGVASTVIGAALSSKIGGRDLFTKGGGSSGTFWKDFGGGIIDGVTTETVDRVFGLGKQNWVSIVGNALGNAWGNHILSNTKMPGANTIEAESGLSRFGFAPPAANGGSSNLFGLEAIVQRGAERYEAGKVGTDTQATAPRVLDMFGGGRGLAAISDKNAGSPGPITYTVRQGDSLSSIAGTSRPESIGRLMAINGLASSTIYPGQILAIEEGEMSVRESRTYREIGQRALDVDNAARALATNETQFASPAQPSTSELLACEVPVVSRGLEGLAWQSTASSTLPPVIENMYGSYEGWWAGINSTFEAMLTEPGGSWHQKAGGLSGMVLVSLPLFGETVYRGVAYDAPNSAAIAGQKAAQAGMLSGHESAVAYLEALQHSLIGFLSLGDAATLGTVGAVRPRAPHALPAAGSGYVSAPKATPMIGDVHSVSATYANAPFARRGWFDPYQAGTRPRVFETQVDLSFVRFHGPNIEGRFMARANEARGMSPEQIRQHFALEVTPTHITDVRVPAGVEIQVGRVGAQPQWGVPNPGGIQYQLLQDIPSSSFTNTRPLR